MKTFNEFLDDVKQNRESEIRTVISKGYSCYNKTYKFFDTFNIELFGGLYKMSLFNNNSDTNFLLVEDSIDDIESVIKKRSRYYSMVDLFDSIIKEDRDGLFLKAITSERRMTANLFYKSNVYALEIPEFIKKDINKVKKDHPVLVHLFLMFALIQNKSNSIFKATSEYTDGIYRFFIVYSTIKCDVSPMKKRGWNYIESGFKHKPYLEMRMIRLKYSGKEMIKEESAFSKLLQQRVSNDEALVLFVNEYNRINKTSYTKEDALKNDALFKITSDLLSDKEAKSCESLKVYGNVNEDKCFRLKGLAIEINEIVHHFMISKFNKKYYLTKSELDEIINSDPSESSINDRSEGSNSSE